MATLQKRGAGYWLAVATIPGLLLSGLLASAAPAAADETQQNHVSQPTTRQSEMKPNTEMDTRHDTAAGRINKRTGAEEGPPVPLSQQKGNQPKSPVLH